MFQARSYFRKSSFASSASASPRSTYQPTSSAQPYEENDSSEYLRATALQKVPVLDQGVYKNTSTGCVSRGPTNEEEMHQDEARLGAEKSGMVRIELELEVDLGAAFEVGLHWIWAEKESLESTNGDCQRHDTRASRSSPTYSCEEDSGGNVVDEPAPQNNNDVHDLECGTEGVRRDNDSNAVILSCTVPKVEGNENRGEISR